MPTAIRASRWIVTALALLALPVPSRAVEVRPTEISAGGRSRPVRVAGPLLVETPAPAPWRETFAPLGYVNGATFQSYDFLTNSTENNGSLFIPPDPIGAVGPNRVIGVVNAGLEARTKTGSFLFRDGLRDFFSPIGSPGVLGTYTFDPKIVYDHYENRFVVVTLERTETAAGDPANASRILIAVSRTDTPSSSASSQWWFYSIDSEVKIGGNSFYWADYPGVEVDEEALYITANLFRYGTGSSGGARLWIVDKGVSGGFYSGGTPSSAIYNPFPGGATVTTLQPALVHGTGGAGPGIGTYLVSYSSITAGGPGGQESVQVIRVDSPLGTPVFTYEQVPVGDIENVGGIYGFPALPDAPQLGSTELIETNDTRALDAVWRDGALWLVASTNPNAAYDPVNAGQTTGHWWKLDTSAVVDSTSPSGLIALDQQGNLGAEDVAAGTYTFFPSLAVNAAGEAAFGFSASAPTIYPGAYYAARGPGDPAGTVSTTGTVQAGMSYYVRMFGDPRNRWGDYSGTANDPSDDRRFWFFNEFAWTRGTVAGTGLGRWKTAWRAISRSCFSIACPPDTQAAGGSVFNLDLCIQNCGGLSQTYIYSVTDDAGWCTHPGGPLGIVSDGTSCVTVTCTIPAGCPPDSTVLRFVVTASTGEVDSCSTVIRSECLAGPMLAVDPAVVFFGTVASGDTTCRNITIRNTGDQDLNLGSVTGCDTLSFSLDPGSLASVIAPGDSTTFAVCYTPLAPGPDTCFIAITSDGGTDTVEVQVAAPTAVPEDALLGGGKPALAPIRPNPFAGSARIRFRTAAAGPVRLEVFDSQGRRVRTLLIEDRPPGDYEIGWDGRTDRGAPAGSGVYFIRLATREATRVTRAVKLR